MKLKLKILIHLIKFYTVKVMYFYGKKQLVK